MHPDCIQRIYQLKKTDKTIIINKNKIITCQVTLLLKFLKYDLMGPNLLLLQCFVFAAKAKPTLLSVFDCCRTIFNYLSIHLVAGHRSMCRRPCCSYVIFRSVRPPAGCATKIGSVNLTIRHFLEF